MPTLTWAGKENATKEAKSIPYRLLELDESLCYGARQTGNVIVQGDNLAELKALMPYYRGRVRCIYIDKRTAYLIQASERENSPKALDIRGFEELINLG